MLTTDQILAHNNKINATNVAKLTKEQQDQLITTGSAAESLMANNDLAVFVTSLKFDIATELGQMTGHSEEINNKRIALANELAGLERFVDQLRYAANLKERLVTLQKGSVSPNR
jgi:hypothetical protein